MSLLIVSLISAIFWSLPYLTSLSAPTVFLALTPALYFVYSRKIQGLKYFILTAVIASCISLFEVRHYSFKVYLASIFITAVFAVAFLWISKKLIMLAGRGYLSLFIPAAVWTTFLVAFNFESLLTGAFDMGIALPYMAPLIWYVGSIGITYLIILWSSSVARALALKDRFSFFAAIAVTMVLLASVFYSLSKDARCLAEEEKAVKVSLIQNNIAKSWEWLQQNPYQVLKVNRKLTEEASKKDPDIIVWPEYSLPIDIVNSHAVIRDAVGEIARDSKGKLVMGSILYQQDSGWHDDIALVMNKKGKIVGTRSSAAPAPFNRFTRKNRISFKPIDDFGTVVCWEELDPDVSREYVNNGAAFLLSLTNNQDIDKTQLKYFAPFYSRARAAENMRYLARSANTGLTQIVDPLGRVVKSLKTDVPGTLTADIYPIERKTFYTKRGPLAVVFANILVGFCSLVTFLNKKNFFKEKRWFIWSP